MSRLEKLLEMVSKKPHDSFARYGLAMEYKSRGRLEEAIPIFESLLSDDPDYLPAYLHLGTALQEQGEAEKAATVLRRGIEEASSSGDAHTRSELEAALEMLSDI